MPPVVVVLNDVVAVSHTFIMPVIVAGDGFTVVVRFAVLMQLALSAVAV